MAYKPTQEANERRPAYRGIKPKLSRIVFIVSAPIPRYYEGKLHAFCAPRAPGEALHRREDRGIVNFWREWLVVVIEICCFRGDIISIKIN